MNNSQFFILMYNETSRSEDYTKIDKSTTENANVLQTFFLKITLFSRMICTSFLHVLILEFFNVIIIDEEIEYIKILIRAK